MEAVLLRQSTTRPLSLELHWQRRLNIQPHNLVKKTKEVIPICSFRSFRQILIKCKTAAMAHVFALSRPDQSIYDARVFDHFQQLLLQSSTFLPSVHSRESNKKSFSYVDMWTTMEKRIKWCMTFFNEHRTEIWRLDSANCPLSYSGVTVSFPFSICSIYVGENRLLWVNHRSPVKLLTDPLTPVALNFGQKTIEFARAKVW